jgi:WD40 repeat protein
MLMRMAIVDEDGSVVRRRAHLDEFETDTDPDADQVLRVLTDARLLTTSAGYVEVAHEALLREWPRLRDWLREDAEGTQLHHHLIQAARDWDERGRDRGDLYRGARLSAALDWTASHEPALNQREHDFLTASRDAHQRDIRRLRVLLAAALVLMAAALVAGVVAYVQRGSAQRAATVADSRGLGAQAQLQPHLDLALLLAREGVALDSTPETRNDLLATLLRSPQALIIRHIPSGVIGPTPFALSSAGDTLAVGTISGKVLLLDAVTLKITRSVTPPGGFKPGRGAATIAASATQPLFAIGSSWPGDGTIALLDARTGRPAGHVLHIPHVQDVITLAFSPDGQTLAVGFRRAGNGQCQGGAGLTYLVTQFDIATGKQLPATTNITESNPCGDSIDKLLYSPSGTELIATDRQGGEPLGRIVAMRTSDLKVVHIYPLPGVTAATFNPKGTTLAVETDYGGLEFMSYPSGVIHRAGTVSPVWSVGYTPDGRTLITTSADHSIGVWDVRSRTVIATLLGHVDAVTSQAISPDGNTLYTASPDRAVIKWDIGGRGSALRDTIQTSPQYPANLFSHPQPTALAVAPNGRLLATSSGNDRVQLWNLKTLQSVGPALLGFHERDQQFSGDGAATLAVSPNGKLLAAGGAHGSTVVVWNVATRRVVDRFVPPTTPECRADPNNVSCPHGGGLAFSPNGTILADGDAASAVLLWNLHTHKVTKFPLGKGDWSQSLGFSADGNDLIAGTVTNNGVLWRLATGKRIATFEADQQGVLGPQSVAPAARATVFAYGANNSVYVRSTTTGSVIGQPMPIPSGYAGSIALSPDGRRVALTAGDGVEVWDTTTGTEITPPLPGAPTQTSNPGGAGNLAFTPDGRRLLISSPTGLTTIWALAPSVWTQQACQVAGREMTQAEWHKYVPDRGYASVCPSGAP